MAKKAPKVTALLLIVLLLAINLTAELSHQHFAAGAWQPAKSLIGQLQKPWPKITSGQQLCPACLFTHQNQSTHNDIAYAVNLPAWVFVSSFPSALFSQFPPLPCRNRAPPA